jgi:UDP-glucose 4-epimerase
VKNEAGRHDASLTTRSMVPRVVAITGATSFLGANLVGLLEEDPRVSRIVAVDVRPASTAGPKTRSYEVDFTQPTVDARLSEIFAAERVSALAHLAFVSSPTSQAAWEHELESVGTMHVLSAARQAQVRKVVMSSSTLLYGAHPSNPNFLSEKHPLRAPKSEAFFANKIEAEIEANKFAARVPGAVVTVLRLAPILGPTVKNFVTRYLAGKLVPTMMGFDPLVQFVHEVDAIAALKHTLFRDAPGTFNIEADGVLPLSTVIKLAGRIAVPIPHPLAGPMTTLAWLFRASSAPPAFLSYLRFLSIADGAKAKDMLGFRPAYTTREAVLDFTSAQHLRDVRLLSEVAS